MNHSLNIVYYYQLIPTLTRIRMIVFYEKNIPDEHIIIEKT
jgi:hypothetical protein